MKNENNTREITWTYFDQIGFAGYHNLHNSDGYGKLSKLKKPVYLLREAKDTIDFDNTKSVYFILMQFLSYFRSINNEGHPSPQVGMIYDRTHFIIFDTLPLVSYISDSTYDWTVNPSAMSDKNNKELYEDLLNDANIILPTPYIFSSRGKSLKNLIENLISNKKLKLPAIPKKLEQIYDHFNKKVITDQTLNEVEKVNIFTSSLTNSDIVHPVGDKQNLLHTLTGTCKINRKEWDRSLGILDLTYTDSEKKNIINFQDSLIEETRRRNKGEFYTPPVLNSAAWELNNEFFIKKGQDIKKTIIWDNCAGTCALTKPLGNTVPNLFLSSLEWPDLISAEKVGINPTAKRFKHDFLNDKLSNYGSSDEKKLFNHIKEGRNLFVMMNPPWARASSGHKGVGKNRTSVANTAISEQMKKLGKMGDASAQLYTQFFFGVDQYNDLGNITIGMWSTPSFLSSQDFKEFRIKILSKYTYEGGMIFDSNLFDGVSKFPAVYTLWKKVEDFQTHNEFTLKKFKQTSSDEFEWDGQITLYNLDSKKSLKDYIKLDEKKLSKINFPGTTDGKNLITKHKSRMYEESLGWLYVDSNCVEKNSTNIGLFSVGFSHGQGVPITKDNVIKCLGYFTYRSLIKKDGYNGKNEYQLPSNIVELEQLNIQSSILSYFLSQNKTQNYDSETFIFNKLIPFGSEVFGKYSTECVYDDGLSKILAPYKDLFWLETEEVINQLKIIFTKMEKTNLIFDSCDLSWKVIKNQIKTNYSEDFELLSLKIDLLKHKIKSKIYELEILY
jgi:hypothetical protein